MANNVAYKKPVHSSSYMAPYSPDRAVDGNVVPIQRWVCTSLPGWLCVHLMGEYWINRYEIFEMNRFGEKWYNYFMNSYIIQVSTDNVNWTTVATNQTQTFNPIKASYVRVYVTGGIQANPQLASIVEFGVYDVQPTDNTLSSLTLISDTIIPAFNKETTSYTSSVANDENEILVKAIPTDTNATLKINGKEVSSPYEPQSISLDVGINKITIEVVPQVGDSKTYTIDVTRASNVDLEKVEVTYMDRTGKEKTDTVNISKDKYDYTHTLTNNRVSSVTITPYSYNTNTSITVNGLDAQSGVASNPINVTNGISIPIITTSHFGVESNSYTLTIIL